MNWIELNRNECVSRTCIAYRTFNSIHFGNSIWYNTIWQSNTATAKLYCPWLPNCIVSYRIAKLNWIESYYELNWIVSVSYQYRVCMSIVCISIYHYQFDFVLTLHSMHSFFLSRIIGTTFCSDRGYWSPSLLFDFILNCGGDVVGTVARCFWYPFTFVKGKRNATEAD